MNSKQKDITLLVILIILLFAINYPWLDRALENFVYVGETAHIERVIDGDTIVAENLNESIRLLGVNAPERGELLYPESKEFLEALVLNETVRLEFTKERYDKYNRILAYIFADNVNINVMLVENGFANYYFYGGRDQHSNALEDAWSECLEKKVNLCEPSAHICKECIEIRDKNTLTNICSFSCDISGWEIKEEGRDKIVFNHTLQPGEQAGFELDLTDSGGSLFLRDSGGKLVVWEKS